MSKKDYLKADAYVGINEGDSVLRPIYLRLPRPPKLNKIDGYGLAPEDQYFRRTGNTRRLQELENRTIRELNDEFDKDKHNVVTPYKIYKRFWDIITEEQDNYKDEIQFIKHVHWHLKYGYWFFNKGKPTWIPPWHYRFLNYWVIKDGGAPEYRDRDRRSEIFEWYCYTSTESFKDLDNDNIAMKNDDGKYEMIDLGHRVCLGSQEPKRRRSGATMRGANKLLYIAYRTMGGNCTIVSDTGDSAKEKIFKNMLVYSWRNEPVWLKPATDKTSDPNSTINYKVPARVFGEKSLESKITYTDSASEGANDGDKLHGLVSDEEGKMKSKDVYKRWEINKLTMKQGPEIHGFCTHPSTVEEMNEGGEVYERMWKESNFYERDPIDGQTRSGLFRMFFKTYDGYDKFIDKWGYSVIDDPTKEQLDHAGPKDGYIKGVGVKKYIDNKRAILIKDGSPEALDKYRQTSRKEPIDSTECFMGGSGDLGFDIQILDKRMAELSYDIKTVPGNFQWVNGEKDGTVEFVPHPDGRWDVSHQPPLNMTNRKVMGEMYLAAERKVIKAYRPEFPTKFIAGADEFDYSNRSQMVKLKYSSSLSDGGLAVFMNRDIAVDTSDNMSEWSGHRFVCTYRERTHSLEDYCEDVLMTCVYYGAMLNFERNKRGLWKYINDRGYGNYIHYMTDPNGKLNTEPGVYTQRKEPMFNAMRDYIRYRGHKERHYKLLKEAKEIQGPEYMTKYDLLTAGMVALLGTQSSYASVVGETTNDEGIDLQDFGGFFTQRAY